MTAKTALFTALFATATMTACSVDAPTDEDFNYSFLDEIPGTPTETFGFTSNPVESRIEVRFRDSMHGTEELEEKVESVRVVIESVAVEKHFGHDQTEWKTLSLDPIEVDLFDLADGEVKRLGGGPIRPGDYGAVALEFGKARVVTIDGEEHELELPGPVLVIERDFKLLDFETAELFINLGALRGLEVAGGEWVADPTPSVLVDYE